MSIVEMSSSAWTLGSGAWVRVTFLGDILMATPPSFDPCHSDMYMYIDDRTKRVEETANVVTLQVGATRLSFEAMTAWEELVYHIAFSIPRNKLAAAKEWLAARRPPRPRLDSAGDRRRRRGSWWPGLADRTPGGQG